VVPAVVQDAALVVEQDVAPVAALAVVLVVE